MNRTMKSIAVLIFLTTLAAACKSSQPASDPNLEAITTPFETFISDHLSYRAVGRGESPDMGVAKKLATHRAKEAMAGEIMSTMKYVNQDYISQYNKGNSQDLSGKFESMSMDVASQVLSGMSIKEVKYFRNKANNTVECYVAMEMSKEEAGKQIVKSMENAAKDKIDFDIFQYRKIYEKTLKESGYEK